MLDLLECTYNCSLDAFCWYFFMPFFVSNTFRIVLLIVFLVLFSAICWFAASSSGVGRHGNPLHVCLTVWLS